MPAAAASAGCLLYPVLCNLAWFCCAARRIALSRAPVSRIRMLSKEQCYPLCTGPYPANSTTGNNHGTLYQQIRLDVLPHRAASFEGLLAGLRPAADEGRPREPLAVGLRPESQLLGPPPPRPGLRCRRWPASCGGCPAAPMSHRLNSRSTCAHSSFRSSATC